MGNNIFILINLVFCFLLGYVVGKCKYFKVMRVVFNYDYKFFMCDY